MASRAKRSADAATLTRLSRAAWRVRAQAHILGETRVGCALLARKAGLFVGCNVEHRYRCHDIHAEVNAISSMVASGGREIVALLVAAERERFTPCGGCLDWIFQFAAPDCVVAYQSSPKGRIIVHTLPELMPLYPQ